MITTRNLVAHPLLLVCLGLGTTSPSRVSGSGTAGGSQEIEVLPLKHTRRSKWGDPALTERSGIGWRATRSERRDSGSTEAR